MKQSSITAVIPAKNEERNIERCIKSVLWCDKVVIMWMGDDNTRVIAKQLGAIVVEMNKMKEDSFVAVQENVNWAIDHCDTDWMLRIDADEVVTEELKEEIQSTLTTQNSEPRTSVVAYGIPRKQYFWGGFLQGGDWTYDRLIRLFKPTFARYTIKNKVHEQFEVKGTIGYLKNALLHYSHPTLADARRKFQLYTDIEIDDLKESTVSATLKKYFIPLYVFLRWMLWHHGYRDGIRGMVAGLYRGWYEYLLYSKYLKRK